MPHWTFQYKILHLKWNMQNLECTFNAFRWILWRFLIRIQWWLSVLFYMRWITFEDDAVQWNKIHGFIPIKKRRIAFNSCKKSKSVQDSKDIIIFFFERCYAACSELNWTAHDYDVLNKTSNRTSQEIQTELLVWQPSLCAPCINIVRALEFNRKIPSHRTRNESQGYLCWVLIFVRELLNSYESLLMLQSICCVSCVSLAFIFYLF